MKHTWRWIEFGLLFAGIPILLLFIEDLFPLIPSILVLLGVVVVLLRRSGWQYRALLELGSRRDWQLMLLVWAGAAVFWTSGVSVWQPELLFSFPAERFGIWLLILFLYPLVSALPQEIIFRTFMWHRYEYLFGGRAWMLIAVSGVSFMWAHLLYMNWFAFSVTLLGGLTFAWRYHVTRSVLLVAVEHGLYGNLFFTLGLGQFLFSGAV